MPRPLPQQPAPRVSSPCIGVCSLDGDDVCNGCARTLDEISRWMRMTSDEQAATLLQAAQRRQTKAAQQ